MQFEPVRIPGLDFTPSSLVELLRWRARTQPARVSYTFLIPGRAGSEREWETVSLTYAELDERVRAVAALLQSEGATGKRALLFCPPGLDYVVAFYGCLFAGVIAVPAYPPRANRNIARLEAIATDAQADFALSTSSHLARDQTSSAIPELRHLRWLPVDGLPLNTATEWRETSPRGDDLAYLQYTSGSTAAPKGVMISHDNVLHNSAYIHHGFAHSQASVSLSWLPHFHDMGLLDGIIQPLFGGFHGLLMSPAAFLQSPLDWLEAITFYGVTHSGGPNFAYELCARRQRARPRDALDLSTWAVAYNGAEPVRADTLEHFAAALAQYGFRWESFYPAYGLAQATLKVTGGKKGLAPVVLRVDADALAKNRVALSATNAVSLVGVGSVGMQTEVRIVNPDTAHPCGPNEVGEIWVSGPGVARGYWQDEAETEKTFGARLAGTDEGPFLRTGDLGFFNDGELFVTGRIKDLIIVRGRNLYPQDLERTAELSHPSLRPGGGAVFSVLVKGEERVVVVHEVDHRQSPDIDEVAGRIREHVALEHEESVYAVALIKPGSMPKTSSGKVQRRACRILFLEGRLKVVGEWREGAQVENDSLPGSIKVEEWIADQIGARIGVPGRGLDRALPLTRLGLNSLSATELVHAIELRFGISVSLSRLLDEATINSLAATIAASEGAESPPAAVYTDTETESLSRGQEALWFLQQLAPESEAYYIARALRINHSISVPLFREAWQRLVERHAILRTTFAEVNGSPAQQVAPSADVFFKHEEAYDYAEEELQRRLDQAAHAPFNLETGPLLRVTLFTLSANEHLLLLAIHHIVSDFRSLTVLLEEFAMVYQALLKDQKADLAPLSSTYLDYVRHQQEWLRGHEAEQQRQYWTNTLGGTLPLLSLPADRPRPLTTTYRGASVCFSLSTELSRALKELAQSEGVTLYMLMLASFQLLLHRYSGQEEILVGSATSGRRAARFADVPGYFVNPVVLRQRFANVAFVTFLASVRRTVLSAFAHQDYPFHELVERLHPQRDPGRNPLFDVMFNWHARYSTTAEGLDAFALGHAGVRSELGGLSVESFALPARAAQFDLTLNMAETLGGLRGVLEYRAELYEERTAGRLVGHLQRLLESVVAQPEGKIWELPLLSAAEQQEVLEGCNQTQREYRGGVCLHELFAEQVKQTPGAVAVVHGEQRLSYAAVEERAEELAERLRRCGVGPESRVGVLLARSPELVIGLLAVLKAGGAYVPLDERYPRERLAFMLADAEAEVVLTQSELMEALPATGARVVCLDREEGLAGERVVAEAVRAENLAYVIYTSGSTGRPKGVAITHASACVLVQWAQETFSRAELRAVLFATSVCFDLSVFELFVPLCSGGLVVVAEDALALAGVAAGEEVTLVNTVPSAMAELVRGGRLPQSVQAVALAGEPLSRELVERVYAGSAAGRVLNLYGPTEDTTYSTWAEVGSGESERVTIGRPVANTRAYILDRELRPVPVGVAGELYLGGAGLARGYLKRPGLTGERFVPDPYSVEAGGRLYRTGDLARQVEGGELEYLGRLDQQVKVRGYRIELGEVEAALAAEAGVRECCVAVSTKEAGAGPRLVAYVVREAGAVVGAGELRARLRARLPEFMVPGTVVFLEALPLTPNGKLDRQALPEARVSGIEGAYLGPRTTAEELVAGIWEELLGVARVGVADNFFELGGHSLLATRMSARLREVFGVEVGVRTVFEAPTVAELARRLGEERETRWPPLVAERGEERRPLSFAQRRLWFLQGLEPESGSYNVAGAVRLQGELEAEALEQALREVVRRHEVLRARISEAEGEPWQEIGADWHAGGWETEDLSAVADAGEREALAQRLAEAVARRPFNLAEGGLLRALLLRLTPQEHQLVLVLHHIVCDGWSLGVLLREMGLLYTAYTQAEPSPLEPLRVQYADYALWQRRWLQGETLASQLNYWRQRLANTTPQMLPMAGFGNAGRRFVAANLKLEFPPMLTNDLRALCRRESVTPYMLLLAAFQTLLHSYTRQEDVVIGTAAANRHVPGVEQLIGFFVNTLAVRADLGGHPSFRELLQRVREVTLDAQEHQDLPYETLVEELRHECKTENLTLFRAYFNLLNFEDQLRLPGLETSYVAMETVPTKFDLQLSVTDTGRELTGLFGYNSALFSASQIENLGRQFITLIENVIADPGRKIAALLPSSREQQAQIIDDFNDEFEISIGV